ncbi:snf7-family protein [Pelomyxa schiedti]|nr:snf7-family protein [Pelomyxa schiedti]
MQEQLLNLRFASKQLQRQSVKSEQNEKREKLKAKKAMEKGNMDGARIYAENAIREKSMALNYLKLSSRIDGVASRVEQAIRMRVVTGSMSGIVKSLDKAMKTMDLAQVTQVMDRFEKQFEDLDVQGAYVEKTMSKSSALSTPASEVDLLLEQVADEHGLELAEDLHDVPIKPPVLRTPEHQQDELTARLEKLKTGGS